MKKIYVLHNINVLKFYTIELEESQLKVNILLKKYVL